MQTIMGAPLSTGIAQAPGEYDYGGKTQGAMLRASYYTNNVYPMDRPFFGCLQPCNSALHRIDFVKTKLIVRFVAQLTTSPFLGCGSVRPPAPFSFAFSLPSPFASESRLRLFFGYAGLNHWQLTWSNVTARQLDKQHLGTCPLLLLHLPRLPLLSSSVATCIKMRVQSHPYAHARIPRSMGCA